MLLNDQCVIEVITEKFKKIPTIKCKRSHHITESVGCSKHSSQTG
jgi:hypothetical protein